MLDIYYTRTSLRRELMAAVLSVLCIILLAPGLAHAWPSEADWIPLINASGAIGDPDSDYTQAHLDIVGDATHPSVMLYNDGDYIYYRIRLDGDPSASGYVKQNTWGILIDTDLNADSYEWMARIDGRPTDSIIISQNTLQGTLGDPSDSAEVDVWVEPLDNTSGSENFKVTVAGTDFPISAPDTDYWLEYRYPYDVWLYYMGLDENSVIRYFVGTGPSGWTLSGDIVGTSLYTDLSSPILPSGTTPTTGSVKFVSDLSGFVNVTSAYPGDTLYIKVEDADRNDQKTALETVTVTVTTAAGDSETVILTETGISTGIFTGSIASTAAAFAAGNSIVDMSPIETVFVTYVDAVDAAFNKNRDRIDSLTALPSADLGVTVGVSNSTPNEGEMLTFTLTLTNYGMSNALGVQVTDLIPSGLIYNSDNGAGRYNPVNGVWSVPSIIKGEVKTLLINATVGPGTEGTTIVDNAAITFNPHVDPVSSNNSFSVYITVAGADLDLSMTVSDATPNENDIITYTLTILNKGKNDATGIIVNDVLPSGVTYFTSPAPLQGTYVAGSWSGFGLVNGASASLIINATVDPGTFGQIITHFANIASADQADPVAANNTASVPIAVAGVDLNLTKSVDIPSPNVGQNVVYTLTLLNEGSNTANAVEITDLLPTGVTNVSNVTIPAATGTYDAATGIWNGFSLAAGASVKLEITASVDPGTGGSTIVNNAQVTGVTETDVDPSDDSASASITVQSADLSVTKTVNKPAPGPSTQVVFTVTLTNKGSGIANNIELTDTMTAGLTYVSHTLNPPGTGTYTSGTGIWNGFDLASGASATLVINATVPATVGSVQSNSIAVTGLDQEDPVSANDSAVAYITVSGVDLKTTKTVDKIAPAAGDVITYTIVIENVGDFPASGIEVLDSLPDGVTYVSETDTQGTYRTSDNLWKTLSIANGASATLTITATVDAGTDGRTIENTARIITITQADIDITNNIDKATIYVGSTDLGIDKSVSDKKPNELDIVSYTLTVTNNGLNNATGVAVTDILPDGVTYLIDNSSGYYNSATGIWNVTNAGYPYLLPGVSRNLVINATVDAGTGGQTIVNNAQITSMDQLDPNSANDFISNSLTVQSADISILKLADDATPNEGGMVSFTLTVTNNGPHNATGITVQDVLPAGLTYDSDNGVGNYVLATGIWNVGSLDKLASTSLVINATADIGTGGTTITNIANIVGADQVDSVALNNSSSFDVSPTAIPWPDLKLEKTVISFWDPINLSLGNQKAIPGSVMQYTLEVTNEGDGSPDTDTLVIDEIIPADTEMYVVGGGITADLADSGLTVSSIDYADSSGYGYTPDDTLPGGFDPAVKNIRVTMGGDFNVSDGTTHPHFYIRFKVRLK